MTSLLKKISGRVHSSGFRSIGTLVMGTAGSQLITFAALPFLTRIFAPADFGVLAMYIALVTIVSVIACARFEIAITIPASDVDAANLLCISLLFALLFGVLFGIFSAIWGSVFLEWTKQGTNLLLFLVPLGIWLGASYSAFRLWSSRKGRFPLVAKTRIGQALIGVGTQIGLGNAGFAPGGLLFGHLLMTGGGVINHARATWSKDRESISQISCKNMVRMLVEYKRYPQYSIIEGLASTASVQIPILIIATFALGSEAGFLLLAMRAVSAPFQMISGAVSQVYLAQGAEHFRKGKLKAFTRKILAGLFGICIVPLTILSIFAVPIFALLFGEEWARSGEILVWLTPWILLKFLASPISWVLNIVGKQRLLMNMKIGMFIVRVSSVLLAHILWGSYLVEAYAISGAIVNLVNLLVYVSESEKH